MRFYGYFRSSAAYRCRIAFNLKGIAPDFAPVHLRRGGGEQFHGAYGALNPQHLVPALEVDGQILTQSLAIIEWLEETRPEPALLPKDPFERAHARAFALAIAAEIHPLNNLRVLGYLKGTLGHDQASVDTWYRHWVDEGLAACEALATRNGHGRFLFGDTPGLADICLVPQLYNARRFHCDLSGLPRLLAVEAAAGEHPAFAAAHPDRQPDAEP
ncbi:maleylacetoacetate isomerase [Xanthobacter autotrophicus]|uniref:maleylacetoacetate isomerase n=1 Tax=Xanthobacter autotrophicus TaxID=280 RepID=UPI0024A6E57C|nr:maleylacetoacetate isomerase [Xanthobacter autotrophicus]MDI4657553.1 maleylacetoacetate isomerase [Xanthobacter autotrophicus]